MANRFDEILIDECQDINEAQDLLFRTLSKEEKTLFLVGDVKQSIYRFRQANPRVFLSRLNLYEQKKIGTVIRLTTNFRSRPDVTSAINFVFGQIMSKPFGGLDYQNREQLLSGGAFPPHPDSATELHSLSLTGSADERTEAEAMYIAERIDCMLREKFPVTDQGVLRPCQPGDFAILLRSGKEIAEVYAKSLKELEIPARLGNTSGYFEAREISLMLSLLKVIANPLLDIPMLSILLSPVFSFTPDEVSRLKIDSKDQTLYECLCRSDEKKSVDFLSLLTKLREAAAVLPVSMLIQKIYDETIFYALFGASESGEQKLANLRLLLLYAQQYER